MISFKCEHCGKEVSFEDDWAGRMGRCPACQQILEIPGEAEDDFAGAVPDASSDDTAELAFTSKAEDAAGDTDIMPAQTADMNGDFSPERARNEADSWLRTYKQKTAQGQAGKPINWPIIIAVAAAVLIAIIILLALL